MYLGDEAQAIPTATSYLTGTSVAYPSDAHHTNFIVPTSNTIPTAPTITKYDTKKLNPASNLRVSIKNLPLIAGQTVEIKARQWTPKAVFPLSPTVDFYDATGATYGGTTTIHVRSGKFLNMYQQ